MSRSLLLAGSMAAAFLAFGLLGAFGGAAAPAATHNGVHILAIPAPAPSPGFGNGYEGLGLGQSQFCQMPQLTLQLQPATVVQGETSMLTASLQVGSVHGILCQGSVSFVYTGPLVPHNGQIVTTNPTLALSSVSVGPGQYATTVTVYMAHGGGISTISQTATLVVLP